MKLLPIEADISLNIKFGDHPECLDVLNVFPDYYGLVGFNKPWIGYFATRNGVEIIGCGGFKGKPQNGKVEIAYATFKKHQGQGIGKEICRKLVLLSLDADPTIRITARTLIENYGSIAILQHNGFICNGMANDEEDGDVWEWEYQRANQPL
jgi:[ribosomal protein S5]-alanine N-acetyltransferase